MQQGYLAKGLTAGRARVTQGRTKVRKYFAHQAQKADAAHRGRMQRIKTSPNAMRRMKAFKGRYTRANTLGHAAAGAAIGSLWHGLGKDIRRSGMRGIYHAVAPKSSYVANVAHSLGHKGSMAVGAGLYGGTMHLAQKIKSPKALQKAENRGWKRAAAKYADPNRRINKAKNWGWKKAGKAFGGLSKRSDKFLAQRVREDIIEAILEAHLQEIAGPSRTERRLDRLDRRTRGKETFFDKIQDRTDRLSRGRVY